jgi:transposase-like protein
MLAGLISFIEICQVKYLNNVIEQDHRFIKKITNPMILKTVVEHIPTNKNQHKLDKEN